MNIGTRIRDLRISKSLTQRQLSDSTGLTQQAISLYEQGACTPSFQALVRIATALDVQPDALLQLDPVAA